MDALTSTSTSREVEGKGECIDVNIKRKGGSEGKDDMLLNSLCPIINSKKYKKKNENEKNEMSEESGALADSLYEMW